ncbi:activator of mitotic machinery Cdc14 phosphatase activation C-term-domain-containing protein [Gilbertella persicaria]|uniref:activator of mitotic machinery Cdc14 phosphatase activation C-term-domain-containing protein n=1 Tax=Gilbertella persicaria TaxID=101096 RepID=UPI002220F8D0|nr:activator of mitotic machinery Cdc14 phosphatase activation C-term-domain-containing protein [Gilbertella persicaria]KAI8098222.1 activator of mitotic machinery Cdc14 phosphatase activation C-term-domain-containing protein [Gilbertella persicaria]
MTTKTKKSWFINLIHDLKKTQKLFTRKASITPDTTAKKQRSLESLLKRKKAIPLETLDSPIVHTRYPIQTEHAIYRLSHLKLCSSQRPLQQQVVISNLMYWYLSVSNTQYSRQKNTSANTSINNLYMQKTYHTPTPKQHNKKADKYKPIKNTEYNPRS